MWYAFAELKHNPYWSTCTNSDIDSDSDGTPDCREQCPFDAEKTEWGLCGCGVVDSDVDSDGDGTIDCNDGCPDDPFKIDPGICGCGQREGSCHKGPQNSPDSDHDSNTKVCFINSLR
jgi:hypothetical protein